MVMRPFKKMSAVCGPHSRTVVVSLITITIQDFGVSNSLSACNTPVVHDPGHLIHTKSGGKLRKNQAVLPLVFLYLPKPFWDQKCNFTEFVKKGNIFICILKTRRCRIYFLFPQKKENSFSGSCSAHDIIPQSIHEYNHFKICQLNILIFNWIILHIGQDGFRYENHNFTNF